jgi:alkylation response protein AidB-like acyl-CoA dehydrogenase
MAPHVSPPPESARTEADVVAAARRLLPQVVAAREECERLRHVPTPMVEALAEAGLLQMYLPRSMGGLELAPLVVFRVIEEISRASGSIGWCTMLATDISDSLGWLDTEVGRAIVGRPADARLAGSIRPQGRAHPVDGGYRIDGHWDFASGINHARWLQCPCVLWDGDKPMRTPSGAPVLRAFLVPVASATIRDTWHVLGLRGTGSHDFLVEDVFVPASHSYSKAGPAIQPGPLYDPRLSLTWLWTATVANAMGIARGAIDAFVELAASKATTMSATLLRDRPLVQARVAEAEAILSGARAYVNTAVGELWARASQRRGDHLDEAIVQARLAITHGMHEAARSVDLIFHAAGTNAVYEKNPLERHFRDIHVALQHGAALPVHMESAGKALLGLRPADAGW